MGDMLQDEELSHDGNRSFTSILNIL